jgi:hypothetical protein
MTAALRLLWVESRHEPIPENRPLRSVRAWAVLPNLRGTLGCSLCRRAAVRTSGPDDPNAPREQARAAADGSSSTQWRVVQTLSLPNQTQ